MAKYDPRSREEVRKTMHEQKHKGTYASERQAVAVGLNKARHKGEKVPKKER